MSRQTDHSQSNGLPEVAFHAIAHLLPGLNRLAENCSISIGQWIILWKLRNSGVPNQHGEFIMLRQDLTDSLEKEGFGEANIVRLLNGLEDKNLIRRISLTQEEREGLFRTTHGGNRQAVVLQEAGEKRIDAFKAEVTAHFEAWRSEQTVMLQQAVATVRSASLQMAKWLLKDRISE
jgi:DNA-binding MarR family transcriptional regulator